MWSVGRLSAHVGSDKYAIEEDDQDDGRGGTGRHLRADATELVHNIAAEEAGRSKHCCNNAADGGAPAMHAEIEATALKRGQGKAGHARKGIMATSRCRKRQDIRQIVALA